MEGLYFSLGCILILLLLWQILTFGAPENRIVDALTLPSPLETLRSMPSLWFDRTLARSAVLSLARVLGGFLLAASIGIPLGVAASSFRRLRSFLQPLSIFGRNIPIAALIPLTLIWFGLDETQKVMFIFLASVAFIYFDSSTAVDGVPDSYLDTAYTLGAKFSPGRGATEAALVGLAYAMIFLLAYLTLSNRPDASVDPLLAAAYRRGLLGVMVLGFVLGFLLWFPILGAPAGPQGPLAPGPARHRQQPAPALRPGFRVHHAGRGDQRQARPGEHHHHEPAPGAPGAYLSVPHHHRPDGVRDRPPDPQGPGPGIPIPGGG